MRIDIHVHLAGLGDYGATGAHGCFISAPMRRTLSFQALKRLLTTPHQAPDQATAAFAERLVRLVDQSIELDYACIFAMDGVYSAAGELIPSESHLYVPNEYVFEVCAKSPKLLPVISINPQRKDALSQLNRWGPLAIALKWLGPMQKFNPTLSEYDRFYDALKELKLPVIAHSGCEHTFPGMAQHLGDPLLYEGILKRGIPVVFSHCGTGSFLAPGHDYSKNFITMLERYDHAYGDTSAFCSLVRYKQLRRFGADRYTGRILHGSDWPIPTSALYFLADLGFNRVFDLNRNPHPLDRDVATKRAMGLPASVFDGAYQLLGDRITNWEQARRRMRHLDA
jgi:predicted TIM-barrel fold metal-dependent hydrolase